MAYDEGLATRLWDIFSHQHNVKERKMFGGLAIMVNGNMCVGILGESLMARVGPNRYENALRQPHARPMDFTGKPMRGYVLVDPDGLETDEQLAQWVQICLDFVTTLPAK